VWEWAAKVSRLVRVRWYFLETFSEVMPMGMRQSIAGGDFFIMDQSTSGMGILFIGWVDMLSTPPPIPISMEPPWIALAMFATAWRPLEH